MFILLIALAFRSAGLVPWGLALFGAEYAVFLLLRGHMIDAYAPLYGAGVLAAAELAYWAVGPQSIGREGRLAGRRLSLVVAVCLAGGGVGALILSASELVLHGGLALELAGVAAAVGALVLLARMARPG